LHAPYKPSGVLRTWGAPVAVVLVLAGSATSQPELATGLVLALLLALTLVFRVGKGGATDGVPDGAPAEAPAETTG
jgi:hypothetical protein